MTRKKTATISRKNLSSPQKTKIPLGEEHQSRIVIASVSPEIDGGLYPVKRTQGEKLKLEAIIISDGHDKLKGNLLYRPIDQEEWKREPLTAHWNDQWWAEFTIAENKDYIYSLEVSIDRFGTWASDFTKRLKAHEVEEIHLQVGIEIIESWRSLSSEESRYLKEQVKELRNLYRGGKTKPEDFETWLSQPKLQQISHRVQDSQNHTEYSKELRVQVDPVYASFSAWYEFFPRSFGENGEHGNFRTAAKMLDYVAELGFDVVYLPPIHPIGTAHRKGKNNSLTPDKDDVGSPWAIGSKEGGHTAIHPQLGSFEDFDYFLRAARSKGIEVALDIAYQCSPDHPWVKEHPEWFKKRPDGSIQYAENPPKKYQDIYPIDFDSSDWQNLWIELKSVIQFWIDRGVKIFRVDNPHTKSFAFWKWALAAIREDHPEVVFLAEAFTRPHIMAHLAKIGYHQSYTYFTWRNTKQELQEYLTELSQTEKAEYYRPNFWPNTPDILADAMKYSTIPHFKQRLILAATMTPNYGVYGPAYELIQNIPLMENKEEYLDSEKYQLRSWDLKAPHSIAPLMKRLNQIRKEESAFRNLRSLKFHETNNPHLIAYSKTSDDGEMVVTVVNLDPHHVQAGQLELVEEDTQVKETEVFQAHDLLTGQRYLWQGSHHYVELNPHKMPAHIFRIRKKLRNEEDFDYYL